MSRTIPRDVWVAVSDVAIKRRDLVEHYARAVFKAHMVSWRSRLGPLSLQEDAILIGGSTELTDEQGLLTVKHPSLVQDRTPEAKIAIGREVIALAGAVSASDSPPPWAVAGTGLTLAAQRFATNYSMTANQTGSVVSAEQVSSFRQRLFPSYNLSARINQIRSIPLPWITPSTKQEMHDAIEHVSRNNPQVLIDYETAVLQTLNDSKWREAVMPSPHERKGLRDGALEITGDGEALTILVGSEQQSRMTPEALMIVAGTIMARAGVEAVDPFPSPGTVIVEGLTDPTMHLAAAVRSDMLLAWCEGLERSDVQPAGPSVRTSLGNESSTLGQ